VACACLKNIIQASEIYKTTLHHIQDVTNSQNIMKNGIIRMKVDIHKQLKMDLHTCTCFIICLGKGTNTTSSACLAITVWVVNDNEVMKNSTNWLIK
jgi:hypothetical protein